MPTGPGSSIYPTVSKRNVEKGGYAWLSPPSWGVGKARHHDIRLHPLSSILFGFAGVTGQSRRYEVLRTVFLRS